MLTLAQLVKPVTEDEALETFLGVLSELGFQATSWQSGSIQLTILRLFARTWSGASSVTSQIAAGGFATLAEIDFLRLLAKHVYDIEPLSASPTIGQITLTASAAAPVATWDAGDIILSTEEEGTPNAVTFTVTEGGSLAPGNSISVEFEADVPGIVGNIAPDTELFFWTPLVGVTATNPALIPESNTWITTPGEDDESKARLSARCIGRWERLHYGNIEGAYKAWALEALPALTRVSVARAEGDGTVTVYGATSLGALTSEQIDEIEAYINGENDGVGRRPINDVLVVESAATETEPPINIIAYVTSDLAPTAASRIVAALLAKIGEVPIGGYKLQGTQGYVIISDLISVAQALDGVRSLSFDVTDNIPLAENEIYLPEINVTVHSVAPGV